MPETTEELDKEEKKIPSALYECVASPENSIFVVDSTCLPTNPFYSIFSSLVRPESESANARAAQAEL